MAIDSLNTTLIGIFYSTKYDVIYKFNTQPKVGRTSGNRRNVMHVLAVILSKICHFFFICQISSIGLHCLPVSGREICPLLIYPRIFLNF